MGISYEEYEEFQSLLQDVTDLPDLTIGDDYGSPDYCPYCLAQEGKPHLMDCAIANLKGKTQMLKARLSWEPDFWG